MQRYEFFFVMFGIFLSICCIYLSIVLFFDALFDAIVPTIPECGLRWYRLRFHCQSADLQGKLGR